MFKKKKTERYEEEVFLPEGYEFTITPIKYGTRLELDPDNYYDSYMEMCILWEGKLTSSYTSDVYTFESIYRRDVDYKVIERALFTRGLVQARAMEDDRIFLDDFEHILGVPREVVSIIVERRR